MKKPKLKIKLEKFDYLLEAASWMGITSLWLLFIFNYKELPQIIPTHYNLKGEVDNLGEKSTLIFLPIVASIIFIGLSIVSRFPHLMNYPTTITIENVRAQYQISTRLLRILKISIVIIFSLILYSTILHANKNSHDLGKWFLPSVLILIFVPIFYYLIKASKDK